VTVLSPKFAQSELERIVAKARQHPEKVEHWFQLLPEGSRDLLAFTMFKMLVAGDQR
jgi:hypothetical protein